MQFSIWPINQQPFHALREIVQHADDAGWHGAWMADHLMAGPDQPDRPVLEAWTVLGALAATTSTLRLGTLVSSNTFRHPGLVAKMAGTLTQIADGRIIVVGLGAGWQRNEHDAYGIAFPDPAARLQALDEACGVVRALLDDGEATTSGPTYQLHDAKALPRPSRRVPLLLGLKGDRALRLVARHADEWNIWADPATLVERRERLGEWCGRVGRDPSTIRVTAQAVLVPADADDGQRLRWERSGLPLLDGRPGPLGDRLAEYRLAGLDELIVPDFALGSGTARLHAMDAFLESASAAAA